MQQDPRRSSPRIGIEALCWEVIGEREHSSLVVDLSSEGARVERPYIPASYVDYDRVELGAAGRTTWVTPPPRPRELERVVPLQLEIPEIDEVMWARGDIVFDELVPVKTNGGPFGLLRRTGYHISLGATRDMRLLRDYVYDMHAKLQAALGIGRVGVGAGPGFPCHGPERSEGPGANDESVDWLRCFG